MAARKSTRAKARKPQSKPALLDVTERLETVSDVILTVADALSSHEGCGSVAMVLLECGLQPLNEARATLDKARKP